MNGRGPTTPGLGDLRLPWLLTTETNWDDPPSGGGRHIAMGEISGDFFHLALRNSIKKCYTQLYGH